MSSISYQYQIAGEIVESNFAFTSLVPLPNAEAACGLPDGITVQLVRESSIDEKARAHYRDSTLETKELLSEEGACCLRIDKLAQGYFVTMTGIVDCFVDETTQRVVLHPFPDCSAEELEHAVLALVYPFLASARGRLVLHASAVAKHKEVVLFIGMSGSGKSTAAYRAAQYDWRVFADDYVVLDPREDGFYAHSVARGVRLREDICQAHELPTSATRLVAGKQQVTTDTRQSSAALRIRGLVFLEPPDEGAVEQKARQTRKELFQLLLHQVFFSFWLVPEHSAELFQQLSRLLTATHSLNASWPSSEELSTLLNTFTVEGS